MVPASAAFISGHGALAMHGTSDLVVVGAGLAGLTAALRGRELGLSVTVLEKGEGEHYPCNTRWSGGIIHIAYRDVAEPPEALHDAILAATSGEIDPTLAATLAHKGRVLVRWLARHGAHYIRPGPAWQNHMLAPPRPLVAGMAWRWRGPDALLRAMRRRFVAAGGVFLQGTRARDLLMEHGRCAGVVAVGTEGEIVLRARAVALCDGGYQADQGLLREGISPAPERVKQRNAGSGTGDGLRMAMAAGAAVSRRDRFYGHLLARDAMVNDRVWPYPELDALALAGVLVGPDGRRFTDEGRSGVSCANSVAALADPLSAMVVFDETIWQGPGRSARIPANPQVARAGATIHQAGSLEELASLAGLSAEGLAATVAAHNAALANGNPGALSPPRSVGRHRAFPIATPPFYAIPVCAGITYTMGGLLIDADARVLRPGGEPIEGLYAAGSTTGGIEGGEDAVYLGGLCKAGVFGLAAAEHAAALRQSLAA
jgi:fumarate reductase flavoprotein subunit